MENIEKKPMRVEKGKKPIKVEKKKLINKNLLTLKFNNKKQFVNVISIIIILFLGSILIFNLFIPSAEKIKDSVVMLEIYDENGEKLGSGSGFCAYRSNYIITNYHVIEGAYSIKIITDDKTTYNVENILVFNEDEDLAIIQIDAKLKPLNISNTKNMKAGSKVTAIGSPKGELNTVSTGIISNADEDGVIRISAPISHGSSGGVLLDKRMRVIGITSSGYDDAQNLNFAIKVERLNELYKFYKNNRNNKTIWNEKLETCYFDELLFSKEEIGLFNNCLDLNYVIPYNMNTFYKMTSPISIINLTSKSDNFSYEEKYYIAEMYDLLLKYMPSTKNKVANSEVVEDAENWKPAQLIFELNIISRYELAVYMIEMDKLSEDQYFQYINNMNLDIPEKVILLLATAGYVPSDLNNHDINEMINWLSDNEVLNYDDKVGILRNLGFNVNYDTGDIRW